MAGICLEFLYVYLIFLPLKESSICFHFFVFFYLKWFHQLQSERDLNV
jgi:hypothetical protein